MIPTGSFPRWTFEATTLLPSLGVLVGMLLCVELGRWVGLRRRAVEGVGVEPAGTTIGSAIFALLALLIAFTFSGAASRYEHRREQSVAESNAIGTAYLRIDLLPGEAQTALRPLFRDYLRARLATFRALPDLEAAQVEYDRSVALQGEIWNTAVPAASSTDNPAVLRLVVPALNEMFDIANARLAAARMHVPEQILRLLYVVALIAALVVGYETSASARRIWLRTALFAIVIAASIFIILDLEFPRSGLIRMDVADQVLEDLLQQMK